MAKKKTNTLGAQLGWRIVHRDTDDPPQGMKPYEVHGFNTVLTWLMNAHDRPVWRLLPVFAGDIDGPKVIFLTAVEALDLIKTYNKATGPKS